jgi:hypothetical protein
LALLTTLAWLTTLALLTTLPATLPPLALRSLLLLLSARRRAWTFCPRPSGVSAAAIGVARLLLRLRLSAFLLRSRLLPNLRGRLLPRLWAARLHIGALLARS